MSLAEPEILFEQAGAAGVVRLNRPAALNALTHGMVTALAQQLMRWSDDPSVTRIVVEAAGARAFCAGGDIRALYELGRAGRQREALSFWRDEYTLNALIRRYPKPYVSLIDGIVMGGGFGLSAHGSHRVAGDRYLFAMPEVGIGFFPDVGATYVLPRLPDATGIYCALSGARLRAADAFVVGLATHVVPSSAFADLRAALCDDIPVDDTLRAFAVTPEPGELAPRRGVIARTMAGEGIAAILAALDREAALDSPDGAFCRTLAAQIRTQSPTSLMIAAEQMRRGVALSFEACMALEFRIVSRIVHGHDFYEGVRALLVDKDHAPRWRPSSLADVDPRDIARHFEPLRDDELVLP